MSEAAPAMDSAPADSGATDTAAAPAAVTAPAAPVVAANNGAIDIFGGLDDETRAYVENKGWVSDDPADAYSRTLEAYQNLEKMVGGRIKIPDTEDSEAWNDLYTRLGRPDDPTGYEVELPDGGDADFHNWYRETAHKHGLNQRQMAGLMQEFDGMMDSRSKSVEEQAAADAQQQMEGLKQEWGAAYENKIAAGKAAAQRLGVDPEMIDTMANSVGLSATLKHFAAIGEAIGEDSFEGGGDKPGGPSGGMGLTPAQAQAQVNELLGDPNFAARYRRGDADAVNRISNLYAMTSGSA